MRIRWMKTPLQVGLAALLGTTGGGHAAETLVGMEQVELLVCEMTRAAAMDLDAGRRKVYVGVFVDEDCGVDEDKMQQVATNTVLRSRMRPQRLWTSGDPSVNIEIDCMRLRSKQHTIWRLAAQPMLAGRMGKTFHIGVGTEFGGTGIAPDQELAAEIKDTVREGGEAAITEWLKLAEEARLGTLCEGRRGTTTKAEQIPQTRTPAKIGVVRQVQHYLAKLGYDPGPADGVAGARTLSAVREFQKRLDISTTGEISEELLMLLKVAEIADLRGPETPRE